MTLLERVLKAPLAPKFGGKLTKSPPVLRSL